MASIEFFRRAMAREGDDRGGGGPPNAAASSSDGGAGGGGGWPAEISRRYERIDALGKGSFGMVWMARRVDEARDEFDDEYVAIKNITIKDEKGKVYAEREISILQELHHPNIIRLIRALPAMGGNRVVIMQLARGPNLHQLVVRRGALGLPLSRLAARHLIAAVSYLHGRACLHRDIKPSNCILACNAVPPTEEYHWYDDDAIWSNGGDARDAVLRNRWKVMLVDFGFARALEDEEIRSKKHLRNSIVYENDSAPAGPPPAAAGAAGKAMAASPLYPNGMPAVAESSGEALGDDDADDGGAWDDDDEDEDDAILQKLAESAASTMRDAYQPTNEAEDAIMGGGTRTRRRESGISMSLPVMPAAAGGGVGVGVGGPASKRTSTARQHVRSMSALGTKAYAAPEIRKKLRHKTQEDFDKQNAAMTECVADYGMIVDAYSVGWTLRVAMTGVPPNFTISEYMRERDNVYLDGEAEESDGEPYGAGGCCCCCPDPGPEPRIVVRDPASLPPEATLLIKKMTEKNPEDRMTVREAQHQPWIAGGEGEARYEVPQGDVPSHHGDPVVPLACASELSELTIRYHMQ